MDTEEELDFDVLYLGFSKEPGGGHLETIEDVEAARKREYDRGLLLSEEAENFCKLIVLHGKLPSEAYIHSFSSYIEGTIITPTMPAYHAKQMLRLPEVKERIQELRDEVVQWGKTTVEEVEYNLRSIAMNPSAKDVDRVQATKALSQLRGFDKQPENQAAGATININLPFMPKVIHHPVHGGITIEHKENNE